MHITVTCVYSPGLDTKLNKFSNSLETWLNEWISEESFGSIARFMFVIVAVFDDPEKNDFFRKKHDKVGSYVHPQTKERVKFFSIAVPFQPQEILLSDDETLRKKLCLEILRCIDDPKVKIPKSVDYANFSKITKGLLERYIEADSSS